MGLLTSTETQEEVKTISAKCLTSEEIQSNLSAFLFTEYHADNAFILEKPINRYGVERLRVLASQGGVIKITRDGSVPQLQNKYTIEPSLSMDQSEVFVEDPSRQYKVSPHCCL